MLLALMLPVLLGFLALVVDLGHYWQVRRQLQIAADAAALAGVRDLDGTLRGMAQARVSARNFGSQHDANGLGVDLDANGGNDPKGDIVLGIWDEKARVFTPATAGTSAASVNAVQVYARRTAGNKTPVAPAFARVFGASDQDLTAMSVAFAPRGGGGPGGKCVFPVTVPSCRVCAPFYVFTGNAEGGPWSTSDHGWSCFNQSKPDANCMDRLFKDFFDGCKDDLARVKSGQEVYTSAGDLMGDRTIEAIHQWIQDAGPEGRIVAVPIVESEYCNHVYPPNGTRPASDKYINLKIVSATTVTFNEGCKDPNDVNCVEYKYHKITAMRPDANECVTYPLEGGETTEPGGGGGGGGGGGSVPYIVQTN